MRRAILPRRPYRPGRTGTRGRFSNQVSSRNISVVINSSDSDYYYDSSDEIKVIGVKNSSPNVNPLLLSDSEEDAPSYSPINSPTIIKTKQSRVKEADWNSKKTPPDIARKRIQKEDHLREQSKPFDMLSPYSASSYSDSIEDNRSSHNHKKNNTRSFSLNVDKHANNNNNYITPNNDINDNNSSQNMNVHSCNNQNTSKNDISLATNQETNIIINPNNPNAAYGPDLNPNINNNNIITNEPKVNIDNNEINNISNNVNNDNMNSIVNTQNKQEIQIPDPIAYIDSNPFQTFTVIRKGKKFSKVSFQLIENNTPYYKTLPKKEGKKTIQLICEERLIDENISAIPTYVGYVRSRHKKCFYTLYTTTKKNERDDREGELLSICFNAINENQENSISKSSDKDIIKTPVTVLMPKYGDPNYPITQRLSLENIVVNGPINQSKYIKLISTQITPDVESAFGSSFYTKSCKNCALIEPNSSKYVFILLKSADEIFNMKVRPPLTPLQGFALALSLIKHSQ